MAKPRVIGLIVDTDVLVYDTIILAAMRAGFVVGTTTHTPLQPLSYRVLFLAVRHIDPKRRSCTRQSLGEIQLPSHHKRPSFK